MNSMCIDTDKNRSYVKIIGRWQNKEIVKSYFEGLKKSVIYLQANFTIFADICLMGSMSKEIENMHQEIQSYLVRHGLLVTAQLASTDDLANYQIHRSTQRSKLPIVKFATREEAELFLDKAGFEIK